MMVYLEMSRLFPDKAIKLKGLIEAQRRQIEKMLGSKQTEDTKLLMAMTAETYEVTRDLLNWTYGVLKEISLDSDALINASKLRHTLELQSKILTEYMNEFPRQNTATIKS